MPSERLDEIRRLRRAFSQLVTIELRAGVEAGTFEVIDLRGTVIAILSLGIDVARWYSPERSATPAEIGHLYGDLVVRMLRPDPAG